MHTATTAPTVLAEFPIIGGEPIRVVQIDADRPTWEVRAGDDVEAPRWARSFTEGDASAAAMAYALDAAGWLTGVLAESHR